MLGEWYLAEPDRLEDERIDLTLGLRGAIRYYNDLVAPGIGNVTFIRQITWSLLSIKYAKSLKVGAIKLANSIEALGLKAFYNSMPDITHYNYRGVRAFVRTSFNELNSYKELSQPRNYVQITYRQNTTRSLPYHTGLGFVNGNTSFEGFTLTGPGEELVSAFESTFNRPSVEAILNDWIYNGKTMSADNLAKRFGPTPSESEKSCMITRLLADVSPVVPGIRGDTGRREKLIRIFHKLTTKCNVQDLFSNFIGDEYVNFRQDLEKGIEFFTLLNAAQAVLVKIYQSLEKAQGRISFDSIDDEGSIEYLQSRCAFFTKQNGSTIHQDAIYFAQQILNFKNESSSIFKFLADRDRRVAVPADDFAVKGPLYRPGIKVENISGVDYLPKSIGNIYELWRDCQ